MKTHSDEEWQQILNKDFLIDEYINKRKSMMNIARDTNSGLLRVKARIHELGITRKRVAHNKRIQNKEKIERLGFIFLDDYISRHTKTRFKCYCGNEFTTEPGKILTGHTKSCGCIYNSRPIGFKGYNEIGSKQFNLIYYGAKRRNICFLITIVDLWNLFIKQDKKCILTGLVLTWDSKLGAGTASVDRINNNKGYTIDNIQIIHKDINMMKRHHSQDYFKYLCYLVSQGYKQDNNFLWWEKVNVQHKDN